VGTNSNSEILKLCVTREEGRIDEVLERRIGYEEDMRRI
jgi:hypothetical protein